MSRPSPALVVASLALLVCMSGTAVAAIPARDGDVHLCYNPRGGDVEAVDTQRDRFRCPRAWRGFIIDARPTEIESPSGRFKLEATNTGARLDGPQGSVELGPTKLRVASDLPIEIVGGSTVDITAGSTMNTTAGLDINALAGRNLSLLANGTGRLRSLGDLTVQSENDNLELLADERARVRGLLAQIDALNSFRVEGKDATFFQSGDFNVRAARTSIEPSPSSP